MVWMPSVSGTATDVPCVKALPSILYCTPAGTATPDSGSAGVSVIVTGVRFQLPSASAETVGAVLSTRIVRTAVVVSLPNRSRTRARTSYDPSAGVHAAGTVDHEPLPAGAA